MSPNRGNCPRRPHSARVAAAAGIAGFGLAVATVLGGCSTSAAPQHAAAAAAAASVNSHPAAATSTAPKPAAVVSLTVPTDLVGKQLGDAKAELAKVGFTNIVVAGGQVTDTDKVDSVPLAGKVLAPNTEIVIVGQAPPPPAVDSGQQGASCAEDASQCYLDGQQCQTGGCVNAARGLSQADVEHQTNEWLAQHPGYCAYGVTGATAPCDSGPGGRHLTDLDPEFRDGNGETKAQACARMGYTLENCPAG